MNNQFKNRFAVMLFALLTLSSINTFSQQKRSVPNNLRCEQLQNPLGIDVTSPTLSWTIKALAPNARGIRQTAYQVVVAGSASGLNLTKGILWNSGKVVSDKTNQSTYSGKPLVSNHTYYWKVRIWDENGLPSAWSTPAFWVMGLLGINDWQAAWISAAGAEKYAHAYKSAKTDFNLRRDLPEFRANKPALSDPNFSSMLLRKPFRVKPELSSAIIHVSGLGQYELSVNGSKIGDHILSPGWSDYTKTVLYDTYDITNKLKQGSNAIGIMLSDGMYNIRPDSVRYVKFLSSYGPLKVIASLKLEYSDGSTQVIGTDRSWKVLPGPVTYSNFFGGEDHDASLEPAGWNTATFREDKAWAPAIDVPSPGGMLKGLSCSAPPVKAIETLKPVKVTRIKPNVWVYDLGQNASMMPRIRVKGSKGAFVRLIPAELLSPDGTVDRRSATQDGVRPAWWQYTTASAGSENWFPRFFYQGARYLQAELYPAPGSAILPVIEELNGVVVHSSASPTGTFSCSNELFNKTYSLVRWAQRSNMMSIMTDCPQREKQGWLEQYHLNGPSLRYNFDMRLLFRKSMNDMSDSQLESGLIPNIAPEFFYASPNPANAFRNSPEWGSSFILVPWQQYLFSGDISLIRTYYPKMKRYLAFLESTAKDNILPKGLGDWYDIGPKPAWGSQLTPESFTATAIYSYDNQVMARMAALLGMNDDAKHYTQKAKEIRQSFNREYYKPETHSYSTGSNTTYAMPVFLGIAEPENRKALMENLVADIRKRGNSFTSGEVGYRFLLGALGREGYSDVIYDMNNQSDRPGYGYQIKMGATALTEKWDAGVGDFGSQNHFMSGQINEWFFEGLTGIGIDENAPGFHRSIIKPAVTGDLTWVKGSYETAAGLIATHWKREGRLFTLDVTVPPNTKATVYVPAENQLNVKESGKPATAATGVKFLRFENKQAVYEVLSGQYNFQSVMN